MIGKLLVIIVVIVAVFLVALTFISYVHHPVVETTTQVYGIPVRVAYTNYHSATIYFESGSPLHVRSETPIVWEALLYAPHSFSLIDNESTTWDTLVSVDNRE